MDRCGTKKDLWGPSCGGLKLRITYIEGMIGFTSTCSPILFSLTALIVGATTPYNMTMMLTMLLMMIINQDNGH